MTQYEYTGSEAFGEDTGTVWPPTGSTAQPLVLSSVPVKQAGRLVKRFAGSSPVVWFIDDERRNREWFRDHHRDHFTVITFSSRSFFEAALRAGFACSAVVTDIFFPSIAVTDDQQANKLLAIYEEINSTLVRDLKNLWQQRRKDWKLDGFTIARDVLERRPPIPLFIFSRKATLLLSTTEFLGEPPAVRNSYWLIEKVDPTCDEETARHAADVQRDRVLSVIAFRSPWWQRLLSALAFRAGPIVFTPEKMRPSGQQPPAR